MAIIRENLLDAVTSPQASDAVEVNGHYRISLQVSATGSPSKAEVYLEGSLDGVTWVSTGLVLDAATGPRLHYSMSVLVRYLRLRLDSMVGGTSPTVSATLMVANLIEG